MYLVYVERAAAAWVRLMDRWGRWEETGRMGRVLWGVCATKVYSRVNLSKRREHRLRSVTNGRAGQRFLIVSLYTVDRSHWGSLHVVLT